MSDTPTMQTRKAARAAANVADEIANATLRPEVPSSLIDLFEKSIARAKDAHDKVTSIMQHSTEAFEEAFSCATRGSTEYRNKVMEIARANANAAFDLAREVVEARTLPEMFDTTLAHQRRQFESAAAHMKELSVLTQKVVSETAEPIRSGMTEPFRMAS